MEDWRFGRVDHLERVIDRNLSRLSTPPRIPRFHAHDFNLKPSFAGYNRWGRGPRPRQRFTKTGDPKLEQVYATHWVWPGKNAFPTDRLSPPAAAEAKREAPSA